MDELIPQAVEAAQSRAWYPLVALLIAIFLGLLRLMGLDIPGKFPEKLQWLPAAALSLLGSFADAFFSGADPKAAVGLAVYAVLVGTTGAVGAHRVRKELATTTPKSASPTGPMAAGVVFLSLLLAAPGVLTGCAGAALLNNPVLTAAVDKALTWVGWVDSFVSSLLKDPNVPPDFGQKYEALRLQFAEVAMVVSQLMAEGEKSQAATLDAVQRLEAIGKEIVALLQSVQITGRSMESVAVPEPRFQ